MHLYHPPCKHMLSPTPPYHFIVFLSNIWLFVVVMRNAFVALKLSNPCPSSQHFGIYACIKKVIAPDWSIHKKIHSHPAAPYGISGFAAIRAGIK